MPTVRAASADEPAVHALVQSMLAELGELYDDDPSTIARTDDDAAWVAVEDDHGAVVACGAVQPLAHTVPGAPVDHGEIKRVYVVPASRGRGLSRVVMDRLVALAQDLGYTWLQLETGDIQVAAVELYRRSGWESIPAYGDYVDDPRTLCFGLALAQPEVTPGAARPSGPRTVPSAGEAEPH